MICEKMINKYVQRYFNRWISNIQIDAVAVRNVHLIVIRVRHLNFA